MDDNHERVYCYFCEQSIDLEEIPEDSNELPSYFAKQIEIGEIGSYTAELGIKREYIDEIQFTCPRCTPQRRHNVMFGMRVDREDYKESVKEFGLSNLRKRATVKLNEDIADIEFHFLMTMEEALALYTMLQITIGLDVVDKTMIHREDMGFFIDGVKYKEE